MSTDKPPRQSMRTLIRKAVKNRYDIAAKINSAGDVTADFMRLAPVADWHTTRSDAGSIRLYNRGFLFFTFGPDA